MGRGHERSRWRKLRRRLWERAPTLHERSRWWKLRRRWWGRSPTLRVRAWLRRASEHDDETPVVFIDVDGLVLPAGYMESPGLSVGERL